MTETKAVYVYVGKPLEFRTFEKYESPIGWFRIDILQKKLESDEDYRSKFSSSELKRVERELEAFLDG